MRFMCYVQEVEIEYMAEMENIDNIMVCQYFKKAANRNLPKIWDTGITIRNVYQSF